MRTLKDKVVVITGASRGIGLAMALRAAKDGAKVSVWAKTKVPHPKLPGTVHSAVEEINSAGGEGLACLTDIRNEEEVAASVERTVSHFGKIDILINNASAIHLTGTVETPMKRYDLMHAVNVRGTFLCSKHCLPHLLDAENPHILNNSPPLNLDPRWFSGHVAYSMAKFGMSLCVLGMAEEYREKGVAINALWPRTTIATAAVQNLLGGDEAIQRCRKPEIMADAAHAILTRKSRDCTGNFFIDDAVLAEEGVKDFDSYAVKPGAELLPDFFV
jgi:citronellol/citronellal dehydrogenase